MSLLWLGVVLGVLVVLALGLRVVGANRWAELIRTHTGQLERGSVDVHSPAQGRLRAPTRFDVNELEGLPAPVQRYFRAVLTDGQPIIAAATIEMVGTMNMSATAARWKRFTSHQRASPQWPERSSTKRPVRAFPCWPFMAAAADTTRAWHSRALWRNKAFG